MKESYQNNSENRRPDVTAWNAAERINLGDDIHSMRANRLLKASAKSESTSKRRMESTPWNRLVWTGAGLLAIAFTTGGAPVSANEAMRVQNDVPAEGSKAPSGFPKETITSSVETFSTGNPRDMSISRYEITDLVGEPLMQLTNEMTETEVIRLPGDVDGILNPPGMDDVLIGTEKAWKPVNQKGHIKENYTGFK